MQKPLDQIADLLKQSAALAQTLADPALKSPESTVHLDAAVTHLKTGNLAEAKARLLDHAKILERSPAPAAPAPAKQG